MENSEINKLTKDIMADSRLNLPNPGFDEQVMRQIQLVSNQELNRKSWTRNFMIFAIAELFALVIIIFLLFMTPGMEYFIGMINNSLRMCQKIGMLAMEYDFLLFSFVIVGFLDVIVNKRATFLFKKSMVFTRHLRNK